MRITPNRFRLYFGLMLLAGALLFSFLNFALPAHGILAPMSMKGRITDAGNHYIFYARNNADISFTDQRPDPTDPDIVMCIPAAFTETSNDVIDGVYVVNGVLHHQDQINTHIGGMLLIDNGRVSIQPTNKGSIFTDEYLKPMQRAGVSLFQQIQIVVNGKAETFTDASKWQRRAVVIMKDGRLNIIETREAITLRQFSEELVELGAQNALYTDMGGWDEGWYKDNHEEIQVIGQNRQSTNRQTNWITLSR